MGGSKKKESNQRRIETPKHKTQNTKPSQMLGANMNSKVEEKKSHVQVQVSFAATEPIAQEEHRKCEENGRRVPITHDATRKKGGS